MCHKVKFASARPARCTFLLPEKGEFEALILKALSGGCLKLSVSHYVKLRMSCEPLGLTAKFVFDQSPPQPPQDEHEEHDEHEEQDEHPEVSESKSLLSDVKLSSQLSLPSEGIES